VVFVLKEKRYLIGKSVLGIFLLVYGTAVVFRLIMGNYFMDRGLADPNYIFLALLCALPFVVGSLMGKNKNLEKHIEVIFSGGMLFSLLFIAVQGALVFSANGMTDEIIARTLIVLPTSALLVLLAAYIGVSTGRAVHK